MQELTILGKMNLPEKKHRPEEYREFLESKLRIIKTEVNEYFKSDFLDDEARITMVDNPELENDKAYIAKHEQEWAKEKGKTVEEWQKTKDKNPATIAELAVTLVLHKLLNDRFIIARASTFDDYKHGVDNVLIDKETGAVVCGFDEVLGFTGDDGGEKKDKKIKESIASGGASLKYGATMIDGKMVRRDLRNMPTFYLSLSKDELHQLLLDLKGTSEVTENEKTIVLKLLASLKSQYENDKSLAVNCFLKRNLDKFANSLEVIKNKIN